MPGRAYLLKERLQDVEQLVAAIRTVAEGGSVIDPKVVEGLVADRARPATSPLGGLTQRERDVLRMMAEGKNNASIASEIVVTERSVEKVIHSIFLKLGLTREPAVHKRVKAVLLYLAESDHAPAEGSVAATVEPRSFSSATKSSPPSASTRSRRRSALLQGRCSPLRFRISLLPPHRPRSPLRACPPAPPTAPRPAPVDRHDQVGRVPGVRRDLDRDSDVRDVLPRIAARWRAHAPRAEAAGRPWRKPRRFVDSFAHGGGQLVQQFLRGDRVFLQQGCGAAQVDGECDQLLLEAVVKRSLDCSAIGISAE